MSLCEKCLCLEFSGPFFPAFGRNTDIYSVNTKYGPENSEYCHFSHSVFNFFISCLPPFLMNGNKIYFLPFTTKYVVFNRRFENSLRKLANMFSTYFEHANVDHIMAVAVLGSKF